MKQGSVLVDDNDSSEHIRTLVYLEHTIQDARTNTDGTRSVVSRRMQYVEIDPEGNTHHAGYAPYLNYRPLMEEKSVVEPVIGAWLQKDLESQTTTYAIAHLVPQHLQEVRQRKEELIAKTMAAVKDRLAKEINYWDHRAEDLKLQEEAGKPNAKINSAKAQQRADDLESRLQKRLEELEQERRLSPLPPVVIGGALVVPIGLLQRLQGKRRADTGTFARETERVEQLAMAAVMATECQLGYEPRDVSKEKCGYDIESLIPGTGQLRFIEVKGRIEDARTVTVTKNEIITALNKPANFILALVQVPKSEEFTEGDVWRVRASKGTYKVRDNGCVVRYVQRPFQKEPDFAVTSVNYDWRELWQQGTTPS